MQSEGESRDCGRPGKAGVASADRRIGPVAAGLIVAGNMIGSGIYLLPATLGAIGSVSLWGWLIVLAGALVLSLTCSLLAVLRPTDPGVAGYVSAALGRRATFHVTYLYWLSVVLGNGAIALAAASYLVRLLPVAGQPAVIVWIAIAMIGLCTLINIGGARAVSRFGGFSLLVGLAPVLLIATIGWLRFDPALFRQSWNVTGSGTAAAVTLSLPSIAWAFLGFESASVAALVVRDPRRNVPLATIGGVLGAGLVYAAMSTVIFGRAPADILARSSAPLADVATRLWGSGAGLIIAGCAAVKALGTLAGWTLVGGELAVAAGSVGAFPPLGRTPHRSLVAYLSIGALLMAMTTLLSTSSSIGEQFGILISSTTLLCLIVYACCGVALFRLRGEFARPAGRRLAGGLGVISVCLCGALILSGDGHLLAFAGLAALSGVVLAGALRRWYPSETQRGIA